MTELYASRSGGGVLLQNVVNVSMPQLLPPVNKYTGSKHGSPNNSCSIEVSFCLLKIKGFNIEMELTNSAGLRQ